MIWAETWKISELLSENFQFLEVKFSIYLNRRVFVLTSRIEVITTVTFVRRGMFAGYTSNLQRFSTKAFVALGKRWPYMATAAILTILEIFRVASLPKRIHHYNLGRVKWKQKCLRACAKCADSHYSAHAQSLIRAIRSTLIHSIVCNDGVSRQRRPRSDCTGCSLILAFSVRLCPKTRFRGLFDKNGLAASEEKKMKIWTDERKWSL